MKQKYVTVSTTYWSTVRVPAEPEDDILERAKKAAAFPVTFYGREDEPEIISQLAVNPRTRK